MGSTYDSVGCFPSRSSLAPTAAHVMLLQFVRALSIYNSCQVPTHFSENPRLGRWVHTQRHQRRLQLKGKKHCMTDERVQLLNDLEFSWEVKPSLERPRATWQQRLDELKNFLAEHGNFHVPAGADPALHSWCQEQKQRLKNVRKGKDGSKRMGPERIKALEDMGFTADVELTTIKVDDEIPETTAAGLTSTEAEAAQVASTLDEYPSAAAVDDACVAETMDI
jgi:Helicase associated domain